MQENEFLIIKKYKFEKHKKQSNKNHPERKNRRQVENCSSHMTHTKKDNGSAQDYRQEAK